MEAIYQVGSSIRRGRAAMIVHTAHALHTVLPCHPPHPSGRPHNPCISSSHAAQRTRTDVCSHVAYHTQTFMGTAAQVVCYG